MNVYDFDGTIYDGDSSVDFWLFCARKNPSAFRKGLPAMVSGTVRYVLGRIPKERWKEQFFSYLNYLPDSGSLVSRFWEEREGRIFRWYLNQKEESDVIVSASPAFLLGPVCKKLGVSLIATEMDPATGRLSGLNCRGKEKVRRFREKYPEAPIEKFYSDSEADTPLAEEAGQAFLVRKGVVREWPRKG